MLIANNCLGSNEGISASRRLDRGTEGRLASESRCRVRWTHGPVAKRCRLSSREAIASGSTERRVWVSGAPTMVSPPTSTAFPETTIRRRSRAAKMAGGCIPRRASPSHRDDDDTRDERSERASVRTHGGRQRRRPPCPPERSVQAEAAEDGRSECVAVVGCVDHPSVLRGLRGGEGDW